MAKKKKPIEKTEPAEYKADFTHVINMSNETIYMPSGAHLLPKGKQEIKTEDKEFINKNINLKPIKE